MSNEPKKFDPHDLMKEENRVGIDPTGNPLKAWLWHTTTEQLEAIEYVIANGKGLGYESIDEFVREAVRDKLALLNKQFMNERIRE
jgi:hypothetical protein